MKNDKLTLQIKKSTIDNIIQTTSAFAAVDFVITLVISQIFT